MTTEDTNPRPEGPAAEPLALRLNNQLGLLPIGPRDHPDPHTMVWSDSELRAIKAYAARCVAAARGRIDQLLRDHQDVSLETLEYMETMRQGPTREEWAEMDARACGDGEPGCRDCADNNGTCPHDGHKCGA